MTLNELQKLNDSDSKKAHKFTSFVQAMGLSKTVWVCRECDTPHDKEILKLEKKPTVCITCKQPRQFRHFPSRAEVRRYFELRLQEKAGMITDLETQRSFPIIVNGRKITRYVADFVYRRNGEEVVEDVKGSKQYTTHEFKIKTKLMSAIYGVEIEIITRR